MSIIERKAIYFDATKAFPFMVHFTVALELRKLWAPLHTTGVKKVALLAFP